MPGKAYIGTSGWNSKKWREHFYDDTPQKLWLRFCAERFTSIEVNSTFYRLQPQSTFEKWRDETPEGFPFAIKGHRYVTHNKKLIDVEEPVTRCRDAASPMGKRLAAVVWRLRAFFKKVERLEKFLPTLQHWGTTRHAIEFRHKTWFDDEVARLPHKKRSRDSVCPTRRIGRCGIESRQTSFTSVYTGTRANTHRAIANPLSKNGQRARSAGYRKTGTCTCPSTMTPKAQRRRMH